MDEDVAKKTAKYEGKGVENIMVVTVKLPVVWDVTP
jgi:hypothetical protein